MWCEQTDINGTEAHGGHCGFKNQIQWKLRKEKLKKKEMKGEDVDLVEQQVKTKHNNKLSAFTPRFHAAPCGDGRATPSAFSRV